MRFHLKKKWQISIFSVFIVNKGILFAFNHINEF